VYSIRTPTGRHHHVENDADEIVGAAGGLQWGSSLDGSRIYTANANSLSIPWSLASGAPSPCPGNYDPVSYPAEDQSPDYVQADTNANFIVCVYQGSDPKRGANTRRLSAEEVATEDCRTIADRSTDAPLCVSHSGGAHRSARIAGVQRSAGSATQTAANSRTSVSRMLLPEGSRNDESIP
jgi:hypothetical protein